METESGIFKNTRDTNFSSIPFFILEHEAQITAKSSFS
jgi:hypothetical protein